MPEICVIRPSIKPAVAWYVLMLLVLAAAAYALYGYSEKQPHSWHALALLLFLVPLKKQIATRMLSLTVDADHLTFETGFLSRARRTVALSNVQDVTATQSLGERIFGLGDLRVETAGQSSAILIEGIDRPREVEDLILARSRGAAKQRSQGSTL